MNTEDKKQTHAGAAWEGNMSERKADYYAQHLANQIVEQVEEAVETVQLTGLPTLLARMVNEYAWELDPLTFSQETVEQFSTILLSAAQPLLTEYLNKLASPPVVVKETWTPPQPYLDDYQKYAVLWYDEWRKSLGAK